MKIKYRKTSEHTSEFPEYAVIIGMSNPLFPAGTVSKAFPGSGAPYWYFKPSELMLEKLKEDGVPIGCDELALEERGGTSTREGAVFQKIGYYLLPGTRPAADVTTNTRRVEITGIQRTLVLGMLTAYKGSDLHDATAEVLAGFSGSEPVVLTPIAVRVCADTIETFLMEIDGPDAEYVRKIQDAFLRALEEGSENV